MHEHTLFHVHAHLTIFVNGARRQVPAGVGIPGAKETQSPKGRYINAGTCFYWLQTHAPDGVIHIESPVRRGFTLGDFFDEWGQPLGADQVGPASGHVTAFYDGKVYRGNPRDLPLVGQAQIELEVGTGEPLIQVTAPCSRLKLFRLAWWLMSQEAHSHARAIHAPASHARRRRR